MVQIKIRLQRLIHVSRRLESDRTEVLKQRIASFNGFARQATTQGKLNAKSEATVVLILDFTQGRRLLVLATTSNRAMLNDMEMTDAFDTQIRVPAISTLSAVNNVLREVGLFENEQEGRQCLSLLEQAGFGAEGKLNIGVKKLLTMAEMARQDPDPVEKLVGSLIQAS